MDLSIDPKSLGWEGTKRMRNPRKFRIEYILDSAFSSFLICSSTFMQTMLSNVCFRKKYFPVSILPYPICEGDGQFFFVFVIQNLSMSIAHTDPYRSNIPVKLPNPHPTSNMLPLRYGINLESVHRLYQRDWLMLSKVE